MNYIGYNNPTSPRHTGYPTGNSPRQNFSAIHIGTREEPYFQVRGFKFEQKTRKIFQNGYGVDLDGDGQFQGNRDGVLAFDINKDGRIDKAEIDESQKRLRLLTEGPKGKPAIIGSNKRYQLQVNERAELMKTYDKDGDGKINAWEIRANGGKLLVDSNNDGTFSANEAQDVGNVRTASGTFSFKGLNYDRTPRHGLLGTPNNLQQASSDVTRVSGFSGGHASYNPWSQLGRGSSWDCSSFWNGFGPGFGCGMPWF